MCISVDTLVFFISWTSSSVCRLGNIFSGFVFVKSVFFLGGGPPSRGETVILKKSYVSSSLVLVSMSSVIVDAVVVGNGTAVIDEMILD